MYSKTSCFLQDTICALFQSFPAFVPQFQDSPPRQQGGMQALRRDENKSTYNYDSIVDRIITHWMKVMVASSRVCSGSAEGQDRTLRGRLPQQRRFHSVYTRLNWNVFIQKAYSNVCQFLQQVDRSNLTCVSS